MTTERLLIQVDENGARIVSRNINEIGKQSGRTHSLVSALKAALLTLGVGFTLRAAVNTLANFSQEMATVKAITNATESQFHALREETKRLGATTRFTASQAAQGAAFLARAGFDTNEVLQTLDGTLRLAQAGNLDLASAADIASNVLRGFRLGAEDTARAIDVLAFAANRSNTNVQQLGDAMKFVGPVASGLGVSMEETVAAISALSDAGIQAGMAGTGLRRVMAELESPTAKSRKILQSFGITADQVKVSQVGLTQALTVMAQAGVDTGTALEIFGQRGGPAFEVMINAIPQISRFNEELKSTEGFASRVADTMDDNLNGAILAAKSAFEALIIAIGDLGAESFLTNFFRSTATALRFLANNLDDALRAVKLLGIGFAIAFRTQITASLVSATVAMKAFTLALLSNPLTAIAVVLSSVVAGLVFFKDEIKLSKDGIATFGDLFTATMDTMNESIEAVTSFFKDNFGSIADFASDIFSDVEFSIEGTLIFTARVVDSFVGLWYGAFKAIISFMDANIVDAFKDIFTRALNASIKIVEDGINVVIKLLNILPKIMLDKVSFNMFDNPAEGAAKNLGMMMANGFNEGFGSINFATGVVDSLLLRADELARKRKEIAGPGADTTLKELDFPDVQLRSVAEVDPEFQNILMDLEKQKTLLGLSNREREIQNNLLQIENSLKRSLTDTELALLEPMLRELQLLADRADILDELRAPQQQFEVGQAALNALLSEGSITLEEFNTKLRELELAALQTSRSLEGGLRRGILTVQEEFTNLAGLAENALVNSFKGAEDALVNFVTTGKLSFKGLIDSMVADLARLAIRQAIMAPLAGILGLSTSGGGGLLSGIAGFNNGGGFTVGGVGGVDRNMMSINGKPVAKVSKGEEVTVTPKNQSGNQRPIQVNFNITTPDANSFRKSENQLYAKAGAAIARASERNN
jgi:TP901 family phage tail tape measure protein/lambda family phage tail tape measure protein